MWKRSVAEVDLNREAPARAPPQALEIGGRGDPNVMVASVASPVRAASSQD